jgi:nitrite reductase/ring-hydroxylating ferredoxin subunit
MMKRLGLLVFMVMTFLSCAKNSGDYVPSVPVNFQAGLSDPRISKLNSPGNAVIVPGYGVKGLLIYRDFSGAYLAYDACSSYLPQNKCGVTIDNTGFTVTDPCSGSKFSLADGSPVKAPATKSLRQYSASTVNFQLIITN